MSKDEEKLYINELQEMADQFDFSCLFRVEQNEGFIKFLPVVSLIVSVITLFIILGKK
jgi:hypothetical protein